VAMAWPRCPALKSKGRFRKNHFLQVVQLEITWTCREFQFILVDSSLFFKPLPNMQGQKCWMDKHFRDNKLRGRHGNMGHRDKTVLWILSMKMGLLSTTRWVLVEYSLSTRWVLRVLSLFHHWRIDWRIVRIVDGQWKQKSTVTWCADSIPPSTKHV
jgi:hypothetical protein